MLEDTTRDDSVKGVVVVGQGDRLRRKRALDAGVALQLRTTHGLCLPAVVVRLDVDAAVDKQLRDLTPPAAPVQNLAIDFAGNTVGQRLVFTHLGAGAQ